MGETSVPALVWNVFGSPAELATALAKTEVKQKLLKGGAESVGSTPEELGAYVRKDIDRIGKLVKAAGITAK